MQLYKSAKLFLPLIYKKHVGKMRCFKFWTVIYLDIKYSKFYIETL